MRGAVQTEIDRIQRVRITPAYAGSSYKPDDVCDYAQDHPRVCGEQPAVSAAVFAPMGSPPRMRGAVGEIPEGKTISRITPAYAGSSQNPKPTAPRSWDHPRVCGEQLSCTFL